MTSSREVGDELEKKVLRDLNQAGESTFESFKPTAGSGSKWQDADIRHNKLVVECKVKNSVKGFSAPTSELNKLIKEAEKQFKDWLYIEQNADGRVMVLMDFNAFLEISEDWRLNNA